MSARLITSKFQGTCSKCKQKTIAVGDRVWWEQGKGCWHIKCPVVNNNESTSSQANKVSGSTVKSSYSFKNSPYYQQHQPKPEKVIEIPEGTRVFNISTAQGGFFPYSQCGFNVGDIIRNTRYNVELGEPIWLCVAKTRRSYIKEDGLSFGLDRDNGFVYYATCIEATERQVEFITGTEK